MSRLLLDSVCKCGVPKPFVVIKCKVCLLLISVCTTVNRKRININTHILYRHRTSFRVFYIRLYYLRDI